LNFSSFERKSRSQIPFSSRLSLSLSLSLFLSLSLSILTCGRKFSKREEKGREKLKKERAAAVFGGLRRQKAENRGMKRRARKKE
jgi:hypothetical protein